MTIFNFISLLGGLGLFFYGMTEMGNGLESIAGSKLESILAKFTSNPIKSVIFGALITVAIQSSSATTVILVGLVNAGILKLSQAIGVIMGANIGTTLTAHILSLTDMESTSPLLQMLNPKTLAPAIAIIGAVLFVFSKSKRKKNVGKILVNCGILFTGLFQMEAAVMPLKDSPFFAQLFSTFSNPILGVAVGALVTAVIQSSTASITILQALSATGLISYSAAFPIIMGQNIGTTVTPVLASVGANKNAKRTAAAHFYFNIIGTVVFLILFYGYQQLVGFAFWNEPVTKAGIAMFHTVFNVGATALLLPFTNWLANLATATIRDKKDEELVEIPMLEERLLSTPSMAIPQAKKCLITMAEYASHNFEVATKMLENYDEKQVEKVHEYENAIDKMEGMLDNYLVSLTSNSMQDYESKTVSVMLQLVIEYERIGDYAISVIERAEEVKDKNVIFSDAAKNELYTLNAAVKEIVSLSVACFKEDSFQIASQVEPLEEAIDIMREMLRVRHIERLKDGLCTIDTGILFLEIITNLERIADHCSNVAFYVISLQRDINMFDKHEYKNNLHKGEQKEFNTQFEAYKEKYVNPIS